MIILGLDPGTTAIGYALIEDGRAPRLHEAGLLPIRSPHPGERLAELYRSLNALVKKWRPRTAAVERLFFAKNAKTAMAVAEARGALLLTAVLAGIIVYEYTPAEIKKAITGTGTADKAQVKKMVCLILPEAKELRGRDDVFDAIAAALACHFKLKGRLYQTG